ncbi:MAG TPA: helix-turn-helix domain-containing protein [Acidimicrobiia bacterium]|jgi:DNA-directed RNA polymerase specialized sigma subunit
MPERALQMEDLDADAIRAEYLDVLETLGDAADAVRAALDGAEAALTTVRDHLREGGMASDFVDVLQPRALRSALSEALDDLERRRHRMQRLLFRLLFAEGMSMSDIGRGWGVSRQLVSRLINEPGRA